MSTPGIRPDNLQHRAPPHAQSCGIPARCEPSTVVLSAWCLWAPVIASWAKPGRLRNGVGHSPHDRINRRTQGKHPFHFASAETAPQSDERCPKQAQPTRETGSVGTTRGQRLASTTRQRQHAGGGPPTARPRTPLTRPAEPCHLAPKLPASPSYNPMGHPKGESPQRFRHKQDLNGVASDFPFSGNAVPVEHRSRRMVAELTVA